MSSNEEPISVQRFRDFLRINTEQPNPDYYKCRDFLFEYAKELGFSHWEYECVPGKPLVGMTFIGSEPSLPSILLYCHTDVVPTFPEHWTYPPYSAHKDADGNIYGRGAQDMKCVGVQYMEALRIILSENGNKPFIRTIHLLWGPDEEIGGHDGMEKFVKTERFKKMNVGFILDEGLASENDVYRVFYAERCVWWFKIICPGAPGHGSRFIGNTAGPKLTSILNSANEFREKQQKFLLDNPKLNLGDVTSINLTKIDGGVQCNVIPSEMVAYFDMRITPSDDFDEMEEMIKNWCKIAGDGVHYEFIQKGMCKVLTPTDESDPWWQQLDAVFKEQGCKIQKEIFIGGTDARYSRELGIPAIGFSPMINTPILLHDHNEFLNERIFLEGIRLYTKIIPRLANLPTAQPAVLPLADIFDNITPPAAAPASPPPVASIFDTNAPTIGSSSIFGNTPPINPGHSQSSSHSPLDLLGSLNSFPPLTSSPIDPKIGSEPTGNPAPLVLPITIGPICPIGPGALAASFEDCYEDTLEQLHQYFGVQHLDECTNPEFFRYPMAGIVYGRGNRHVIPLKVRASENSKNYVVFFVMDSGAPYTSLTKKTMRTLSGRADLQEIIIQDKKVICQPSSSFQESMKHINLLGSQFIFHSNICCIFSPHEFKYLSDKMRVFYLAPFWMVNQAVIMANSHNQNPHIIKRQNKFQSSHPEQLIHKLFPPHEPKEESTLTSSKEASSKETSSKESSSKETSSKESSVDSQNSPIDQIELRKRKEPRNGRQKDEAGSPQKITKMLSEEPISVQRFREFLRINTEQPKPDYYKCLNFLFGYAGELGFKPWQYECVSGKPLVRMTINGSDTSLPSILLYCHTDVVPTFPEHWTYPPYDAHKDADGNIYGRGAQDMKCVGVQYMEALRIILSENGNKPFIRTIHLLWGPDEEIGGHDGMEKFVKTDQFKKLNVGFILDEGLASENDVYRVFYAERCVWWFKIICPGASGHDSRFIENTAGPKLTSILNSANEFREKQQKFLLDNPKLNLGDVTSINLTKIDGGVQCNVIPSEMVAYFDMRITPSDDFDEMEEMIKNWCKIAGDGVHYEFIQKGMCKVLTPTDESDPWWQQLDAVFKEQGCKIQKEIFIGGTDARYSRELGIPAIGFSPMINTPILLHDHNEFLNERIYLEGIRLYTKIIPRLANLPKSSGK